MDEVYLATSFLHLNYADFATKVLDYDQKAPILFLWLVKSATNIFGTNEMALRLIPLLSGIASLILFATIAKHFLRNWGLLIALTIFAFSPAIIYHSVEIKQYATECLATILALYLWIRYQNPLLLKDKILWGIYGALILWFSYSAIFVFGGMALAISLYHLFRKEWKLFIHNAVPFIIWLISFVINFIFFTHKQADSPWVIHWFKVYDYFMPFPPKNLTELKWFPRHFLQMMDYPLGLTWDITSVRRNALLKAFTLPFVNSALLGLGLIALYRRAIKIFFILLSPILLMLIASGLNLYPLMERFWLFISPILILFIAIGFEFFQQRIKSKQIMIPVIILSLICPVFLALYFTIHPNKFYKHKKSFEKEGLVYIDQHFQKGDAVYNYWNNSPGYELYKAINLIKFSALEGHDYRSQSNSIITYNNNLQSDFKKLAGYKRIWLIFNTQILSNIGDPIDQPRWYYKGGLTPTGNLIHEFSKLGKPLKKLVYSDVTVILISQDYRKQ